MAFTAKQQQVIDGARALMPPMFSANVEDFRILAFAEVVLADINLFPPMTGHTVATLSDTVAPILYFGVSLFSELFLQQNATLADFAFNDNGLSVQVDQVGKIDVSYRNMLEIYRNLILQYKKTQILAVGGVGLGSPRYQSQIGQFLKISLGSAFSWNNP